MDGFLPDSKKNMSVQSPDANGPIAQRFRCSLSMFQTISLQTPAMTSRESWSLEKSLISEKRLLFRSFSGTRDLGMLVRKCVNAYVIQIKEADQSLEFRRASSRRTQSDSDTNTVEEGSDRSPVSVEGFAFLENFVVQLREESSLEGASAADVARFRLLANSLSKPGNHEMYVGVHDLNILYLARSSGGLAQGDREVLSLTRLALAEHPLRKRTVFGVGIR